MKCVDKNPCPVKQLSCLRIIASFCEAGEIFVFMLMPDVKTVIKDDKRNITITILSYRKLQQEEIDYHLAELLKKKKKLKNNCTYEIRAIFGARDSL